MPSSARSLHFLSDLACPLPSQQGFSFPSLVSTRVSPKIHVDKVYGQSFARTFVGPHSFVIDFFLPPTETPPNVSWNVWSIRAENNIRYARKHNLCARHAFDLQLPDLLTFYPANFFLYESVGLNTPYSPEETTAQPHGELAKRKRPAPTLRYRSPATPFCFFTRLFSPKPSHAIPKRRVFSRKP